MAWTKSERLAALVIPLVLLGAGLALWLFKEPSIGRGVFTEPGRNTGPDRAARHAQLEARERKVSETFWAKEKLAQQAGLTFDLLWDSLNAATNGLQAASEFPVGEIVLPRWAKPQFLPHGIELRTPDGTGPALGSAAWRGLVQDFAQAGWRLVQTEFRHIRFDTDQAGRARESTFYFSGHLTHPARSERAVLKGELVVEWKEPGPNGELPAVNRIDAAGLTLKTRRGEPPFELVLSEEIIPDAGAYFIDPLILYDTNNDGLLEIILASKNRIYRRGANRYEPETFCRRAGGAIFTGIMGDFDGDGAADFLAEQAGGLVLYRGSPEGVFDQAGTPAWIPPEPLRNVMALTCGDIDGDGALDLFLGQYKIPTLGQILRPNYYDANDSHPAYLLLNDGRGNFTDATAESGLEEKRRRRVFSASFADLNANGRLDLLVVSDFAGVDLYRNDGAGRFTDVTDEWAADTKGFGMGHALADFNRNGRLDFLMIGMNSPAVDRLEHLGLRRPRPSEDRSMRARMTFGNRLFLARTESGFEQTPLNEAIARTGWSWGCGAFDFDNDGFPDVYIANGHESRASVRDYEPEFWLHDIFIDRSVDDLAATAYFTAKFARTRGQGWSYGGYEKNRLYLNRAGRSFIEVGHLMGVALQEDSRNVVAADLDGDGRMDLLVTTFEVWPEAKQTLRVYKNRLAGTGNWIGFRFQEEGLGVFPSGARVTLHYDGHQAAGQVVTGDSFRAQHPNTLHFGLGPADRVDNAEIRWPNGAVLTLEAPAVNRYHSIRAPAGPARQE